MVQEKTALKVPVKFINRADRKISHVFDDDSEIFNRPICDKTLGIWKSHYAYGSSTVTDEPEFTLCKRCAQKLTQALPLAENVEDTLVSACFVDWIDDNTFDNHLGTTGWYICDVHGQFMEAPYCPVSGNMPRCPKNQSEV